jgi:hypothetical protein
LSINIIENPTSGYLSEMKSWSFRVFFDRLLFDSKWNPRGPLQIMPADLDIEKTGRMIPRNAPYHMRFFSIPGSLVLFLTESEHPSERYLVILRESSIFLQCSTKEAVI